MLQLIIVLNEQFPDNGKIKTWIVSQFNVSPESEDQIAVLGRKTRRISIT